jgi:O-antigen ligase
MIIAIGTAAPLANVKQELLFQDYSGGLRVDMWGEAVELISDHPILGTGLSSYRAQIHRYRIDKWIEIYQYPHNILLNFWIEIGVLGVLGFVLIFYWVFKIIIPPLSKGGLGGVLKGLFATFTIILIHGIVDVPYFKNDLAVLFWLLVTLVIINSTQKQKAAKITSLL